jgi:hypothetical protein
MKKVTTLLLALLCAGSIYAQPNWLDPQQRKTEYPDNVFFTGFAPDEILSGESKNDATARVTKMAQGYGLNLILRC